MTVIGAARSALKLRAFLSQRLTLPHCYASIQGHIESREDNFIAVLTQSVYANPGNPYRKLLKHAGCDIEDVRRMLKRFGLEN